MKYALASFALIITLVGGFVIGAYYMYNKYNPAEVEETVAEEPAEEVVDESAYYDSDGNWIFKYSEDESGYGGNSSTVSAGGQASENIDYRITGTNFVYEDDGYYSGFHAVVSVENIGSNNLYLGKDSVFNIEDRNLEVVDSYDYVRAVPDVIAPGEKGYFYVPYGQIKTIEDSVNINENALSGDVLDAEDDAAQEGSVTGDEENNSVDIEELEKALGIDEESTGEENTEGEGTDEGSASDNTSASIKVDAEVLMAAAESDSNTAEASKDNSAKAEEAAEGESALEGEAPADESEAAEPEEGASAEGSTSEASTEAGDSSVGEAESGETEEGASEDGTATGTEGSDASTEESAVEETVTEYPGLSLYKVNEYFIMPQLDVQKCADDPKSDYEIDNIVYGSNESGYFTLSADVTNNTDANTDYIPVTVVALDRRGNAIAVGRDALTDFYSGATRSFGVSYILTREQRSNIVQCVVYAREAVSK